MKDKASLVKFLALFTGLAVLFQVAPSYADWDGHHGRGPFRYRDHPHYGVRVDILPHSYFTVWAGRQRYYYSDGLYYRPIGREYVIIQPPVGAYVNTIPSDYTPITINDTTYYTNNGIFYVHTPMGFKVVSSPIGIETAFTVNIPKTKGGYQSVIIRKSSNGFIGPQGEFYEEFPKVSQLQAMYDK
ncbi:MAG: hypothetical protein KGJ09_02125 [Candidatus Omnitrophica bacterium]|nr:hypothetical protein [Candidatus Omnitrophota bacterium]MDE2008855.1 hypothetical protein [Candidatus Omnitrophota bacterium]MDE2213582.1 hypothetical protein [Candidatus Omnitrophota bacterium]MDE2230517.1 hypothetical protein [Candidatus Omnitrophota bacterium]